jgi:hypothetical protein
VPPRGWRYPQVLSSGQTVEVIGYSFEQLLENLLEFRRRHSDLCGGADKASIDAVRADYREYVCKHFRQNCASTSSSPTTQIGGIGMTNYVSPINKAGDWLSQIGNQRLEHVDAALAAQRAQICSACPQNVAWQTPCGPCNDNIRVRSQNAKGSLGTPYDNRLGVCRVYGHMNEVAVWLKDTHSSSHTQAPAICWHNTEKDNAPST